MNPEVVKAIEAIQEPEVLEMLKRLSAYNLGICVPHAHSENEEFSILPEGIVSFEENLHVSFRSATEPEVAEAVPVAWRWNDGPEMCGKCHSSRHSPS